MHYELSEITQAHYIFCCGIVQLKINICGESEGRVTGTQLFRQSACKRGNVKQESIGEHI